MSQLLADTTPRLLRIHPSVNRGQNTCEKGQTATKLVPVHILSGFCLKKEFAKKFLV
jgi:hypothetical protein